MKIYSQDDVNNLLAERIKTDFLERVVKLIDDTYNRGFGDGYKKGFEAEKPNDVHNL